MKVQIQDRDALSSLKTSNLRSYLQSRGWADSGLWGERATIHVKEYEGRDWEILIPLRDTVADYAEAMAEAVAVLATVEERSQLDVFYDLEGTGSQVTAQSNHKGDGSMATAEMGRLERVALRDIWTTEAQDFTPWLAQPENLAVLSETLNMDLDTAGQEESVGPFRADILCRDTLDDSWVLIENQLERTDHTHLGQLLTYAAGLQTVTIIWVAATFTDEHRAALDWLNEITEERFRFFGLEVELWRIGNSPAAPKFNIVAQPNEWTRSVKQTRNGSGANLEHRRFWEQLHSHLKQSGSLVTLEEPKRKHWLKSSTSNESFLVAVGRLPNGLIRVDMRCIGANRHANLELLKQQQEEIESGIGEPLVWPSANRFLVQLRYQHSVDLMDESRWTEQIEWMADALERFDRVLGPRIQKIHSNQV